ncbi:peptidylprolyl isomerase [Solidesulfovibrio sp.]|uniref:peptidylprolyl isomerase n=1 Tax=Solidesulfovibrio sp. TaxID=2910990 RepID=UPI00262E0381|nr:peptidylprolyl isomerase [Solidesulfovibrio sp.]
MSTARRTLAFALAVGLGLGLGGCRGEPGEEPGVVAVVGQEPIRLADVRARHDMGQIGAPAMDNPAVERLRAEYGAVLAEMIVARLAAQELAKRGQAVSKAEIDAAEAKARADYSDEAFSRMLLEERIDPVRWRELLADRLALEKLSREVLRPGVRVDVTEAANFYKEHVADFAMPARVRLVRVQGETVEALKAAQAAAKKGGQTALNGLSGVAATELDLPEANLPAPWREALKALKPGEASAVVSDGKDGKNGKGGDFFVLLERRPATVLDPAKAYARVEATLAAKKLDAAFAAWLDAAVAGTKITVTPLLLADRQEAPKAEPAPGPDELALAREEAAGRERLAREAKKAVESRRAEPEPAPAAPPVQPAPSPAPASPAGPEQNASVAPPAPGAPGPSAPGKEAAPESPVPVVASEAAPASPVDAAPASQETPRQDASAEAAPAAQAASAQGASSASAEAPPASGTAATPAPAVEKSAGDAVEFTAIKASWLLYTVDDGQEQRVYLKPGKPFRLDFTRKLVVRPGSPSEVSYSHGGRETTVVVGKKESRVLEFP